MSWTCALADEVASPLRPHKPSARFMTDLTIATWNINSVRLRVDTVLAYLREHTPDVLALQKIKATDEQFPAEAFVEAGWPHIAVNGFMGYNGVAIVSRVPFADTGQKDWCGKTDGRHVWAVLPGGIELNNFYVPAGGDVPDPDLNPKFAHKLQFVDDMTCWFAARKAPKNRLVLVGDLNIAPLEAGRLVPQTAFEGGQPYPGRSRRDGTAQKSA